MQAERQRAGEQITDGDEPSAETGTSSGNNWRTVNPSQPNQTGVPPKSFPSSQTPRDNNGEPDTHRADCRYTTARETPAR